SMFSYRLSIFISLSVGASLGLAFWLLGSLGLGIFERGTRLPELSLRNAAGESVQLADFRGRPLVVNLLASLWFSSLSHT
ncbi:TlpA family protein disulfide reductase, partial [Klebsiella pneumoniae]|uniref:TlpA family protein disulfide reductase n=1 Tax=Klebsiella pneumoniae TaxID=573 RepID=UPI0039696467